MGPRSPALEGGLSTTGPPGMSQTRGILIRTPTLHLSFLLCWHLHWWSKSNGWYNCFSTNAGSTTYSFLKSQFYSRWSSKMINLIKPWVWNTYRLPRSLSGKESACQCRRCAFEPWVGKILWRREWQPTPVFLPGESHRQRSLAGCSPRGLKELDTTEQQSMSLCAQIHVFSFTFSVLSEKRDT